MSDKDDKETGGELRRAPRFETRQQVWFEGQQTRLSAETRNMSSSGLFVVSEHARNVGERLEMSFSDPEAGEVSMQVEVVWRGADTQNAPTPMGLKVIGFQKGQQAFQQFVQRHLSPASDNGDDDPDPEK